MLEISLVVPAKHCWYYFARIFTTTDYQNFLISKKKKEKKKGMPACIILVTIKCKRIDKKKSVLRSIFATFH